MASSILAISVGAEIAAKPEISGLWEGWRAQDGEVLRTFAILTASANATMRVLHERMSVIPEERDRPRWLGEVDGDMGGLIHLAGDDLLHLWPVSCAVNSFRNNGAELLDDIDDPPAPPPSDAPT